VAAHLPLRAARGQVSHLPAAAGSAPDIVVCRLGYVTPAIDGLRCAGATFCRRRRRDRAACSRPCRKPGQTRFHPAGLRQGHRPGDLGGRVGFRPLSPDRLPMIGAVADATAIEAARPSRPLAEMPRLPGLYLINGFGARGIVWSALAGELLACLITGAPLPLADDLVSAVDPGRFLLRGRSQRAGAATARRVSTGESSVKSERENCAVVALHGCPQSVTLRFFSRKSRAWKTSPQAPTR
jgi:tRNA 5-methylaminomethyl-2-thiouridine biosynthesis bifunctional protein